MSQKRKIVGLLSVLFLIALVSVPVARADWKAEWDDLVATAKKEGRLVIAGPPGSAYRDVMKGFEERYPEIKLEFSGFKSRDLPIRLYREREAGKFLWDVNVWGTDSYDVKAREAGHLIALRPVLILPEILNEAVWFGGWKGAYLDPDMQYIFSFQSQVTPQVYANRDIIPEDKVNSIKRLVEPEWKGKIAFHDPRRPGAGNGRAAFWLGLLGEEFLRGLLKQDLGITGDYRQIVEWVVRGKYPIGIAVSDTILAKFNREGLGKNVKQFGGKAPEAWRLSSGFGTVRLYSKAPNPNAAKLFVNWLLSKEGQQRWATVTARPSRRLDVQPISGLSPEAGIDYFDLDHWDRLHLREKAAKIAKEVLK